MCSEFYGKRRFFFFQILFVIVDIVLDRGKTTENLVKVGLLHDVIGGLTANFLQMHTGMLQLTFQVTFLFMLEKLISTYTR